MINNPLMLMTRQDKGRADRRRHHRFGSFDGLPDDLVEEKIVGAILNFQVKAHRNFGHGCPPRVSRVQVDPRRAMDVVNVVGLGNECVEHGRAAASNCDMGSSPRINSMVRSIDDVLYSVESTEWCLM